MKFLISKGMLEGYSGIQITIKDGVTNQITYHLVRIIDFQ